MRWSGEWRGEERVRRFKAAMVVNDDSCLFRSSFDCCTSMSNQEREEAGGGKSKAVDKESGIRGRAIRLTVERTRMRRDSGRR